MISLKHEEEFLDFDDVLIHPCAVDSSITSRRDVSLERSILGTMTVPIMAANMDGVGTFSMARAMSERKNANCYYKTQNA